MDCKRLAKRLVHVLRRPLLAWCVGGIVGILPDADHLLFWAWPTLFGLFGAGGRPLHIPLMLGWMYIWLFGFAQYAGLGILIQRDKVIEKLATIVVLFWVFIVSVITGGIVILLWELRWLFI